MEEKKKNFIPLIISVNVIVLMIIIYLASE